MNKPIYATDENALEQLRARLAEQKSTHEEMKRKNQYYRKNGTMKGYPDMVDEEAERIDKRIDGDYSWCKAPYPQYILQNSNQQMKATEARIKQLEAEEKRAESGEETDYKTDGLGFEVHENRDIGRLQIFFPNGGRVDKATYESLRKRGFVFSRTNEAFQRQLNENSRWAAKRFVEEQRALLGAEPTVKKSEVVAE